MATVLFRKEAAADPLGEVLSRYLLTGDEDALETVVRETRPRLLAAARRIGDPQDAEDAVQSAYLSLVRKRGGPLGAPVFPWLLTAVVRLAYRRKAVVRRDADLARRLARPPEGPSPWRDAAEGEGAERLRREVDRLPERYRDPVVLHDLNGLSAAEVGRLLDLPEATVRTRVRRARALLRWRLPPGLSLGLLVIPWFLQDAAGSAGGGAAMAAMGGAMKIGGVAAIVAASVGVGVLVGKTVLGGPPAAETEARVKAEQDRAEGAVKESREIGERLKAVEGRLAAAEARAAKAEDERTRAVVERDEAREKLAAAAAASPGAAAAAKDVPQSFSFPEYDEVLAKVDWKSVGTNTSQMLPVLSDLRTSAKEGGKLDFAAAGKIQQLNGALIREAGKIHETLPGTGVNGAFTHPSFMLNSIAATLEESGKPLSTAQHEALGKVGREFSDRERAREAGYDDRTLGIQKVVDEATLKDSFFDAAAALLSPDQRDVLWPAATKGILGFDLYSSGLMLATVVNPFVVADREAFAAQVEKGIFDRAKIPEESRAALHGIVTAWAADLPASWFAADTETLAGMQPLLRKDLVLDAARRQVPLIQKLVSDLGLDAAKADQIRRGPVILVPWVKKGG